MDVRYYLDGRGDEPVNTYFDRLLRQGDRSAIASFEFLIDLLIEIGPPLGRPRDRRIHPGTRMYELRVGNHRVAYVWSGQTVWLLHAWRKQTQKLDDRALRTALRRLKELDLG